MHILGIYWLIYHVEIIEYQINSFLYSIRVHTRCFAGSTLLGIMLEKNKTFFYRPTHPKTFLLRIKGITHNRSISILN